MQPSQRPSFRPALAFLAPLAAAGLFLAGPASAQIHVEGVPASSQTALAPELPTRVVPPVDVGRYLAEDAVRGPFPLRYGAVVEVAYDSGFDGRWDMAADGTLVWRLRIQSPGALSLGLEFTAFQLDPGAKMFVYDDARGTLLGAYTDANHREDGGFVIEPFPGDSLVLELDLPAGEVGSTHVLVSAVIHDYRGVLDILRRPIPVAGEGSGDGACLIDVNCPQGASWPLQKRAAIRTLSGGGLCSAVLINNTANDATRYILTANHCGQGTNTVFAFNYEKPGCGTGTAPTNHTVTGATLLTTNGTYDNRLMRITSTIPVSYAPYYAGWTRSTTASTLAFSMGHPSGGPKKISIDNTGAIQESQYWRVTWHEGTLEGGSSGGPLFDQNGRIRGPACCVSSFTCSQTAYFDHFNQFWGANNIAQWLDPLGLNPTFIDGFDPSGGPPPGPPTITAVNPPTVEAVAPEGAQLITLTGTNFSSVTSVTLDGVALSAGGWSVAGGTSLSFNLSLQQDLLPINIVVTNPGGSASTFLFVEACNPPVIDLLGSTPGFLLNGAGLDVTMGSEQGDLVFLTISTSTTPSVLPGVVDFGIGNNFTQLLQLGTFTVDATKGWVKFLSGPTSVPAGTTVHVQAATFPSESPASLTESSNIQSGTFIF